jgi:hypothetical protein
MSPATGFATARKSCAGARTRSPLNVAWISFDKSQRNDDRTTLAKPTEDRVRDRAQRLKDWGSNGPMRGWLKRNA